MTREEVLCEAARKYTQNLLRILDVLIDLGDRHRAALEQTGAFKNVQRPSQKTGFP